MSSFQHRLSPMTPMIVVIVGIIVCRSVCLCSVKGLCHCSELVKCMQYAISNFILTCVSRGATAIDGQTLFCNYVFSISNKIKNKTNFLLILNFTIKTIQVQLPIKLKWLFFSHS